MLSSLPHPGPPLVSVVIPAYNAGRFIAQALSSVLTQDYPSIEVVVVDDGSTDNTRDQVAAFGPTVRLLTQPRSGAGAARNLGILATSGRYVAFLDADDVWLPGKLSRQVDALRHSGHGMSHGAYLRWHAGADGHFEEPLQYAASALRADLVDGPAVCGSPYVELLERCIIWTSTVLVERAALEASGLFDTRLHKGQDYELWLRLSRSVSMLALHEPLALYRIHAASISHRALPLDYQYEILTQAEARYGLIGPDGRAYPRTRFRARLANAALNHALMHLHRGDPLVAMTSIGRVMRHGGWRPKLGLFWLWAAARAGMARLRHAGGVGTAGPAATRPS